MTTQEKPGSTHAADAIQAFDTVYTTNSIQLLKLALPLLGEPARPLLAAVIKARELSYCYQLILHTRMQTISFLPDYLDTFLGEAAPFCNPEQRSLFRSMQQLMKTMRILEKMQILNEEMPFGEEGDLSQLLLLMPQLFGEEAEGFKDRKPREKTDTEFRNDDKKQSTGGNDPGKNNTDGNTGSDAYAGETGERTNSDEAETENNTAEDDTAENNPRKTEIPPVLQNALTPRQKELYEQFMQKFTQ